MTTCMCLFSFLHAVDGERVQSRVKRKGVCVCVVVVAVGGGFSVCVRGCLFSNKWAVKYVRLCKT